MGYRKATGLECNCLRHICRIIHHLNFGRSWTAAKRAAAIKTTKYSNITSTRIFYPISNETAGSWDVQEVELMEEIGRRITVATNDQIETMYLFQRISIAIQMDNALSFFHTFNNVID